MAQGKAGCGLSGRAPRAHRFDESAAGYSLAGCSPAEPASASPAALIMPRFGWIRYAFSVNRNTSLISWPRLRGPLQAVPELASGALKTLEGFLGDIGAEGGRLAYKLLEQVLGPRRLRHACKLPVAEVERANEGLIHIAAAVAKAASCCLKFYNM